MTGESLRFNKLPSFSRERVKKSELHHSPLAGDHKSDGVRPVCFAILESITEPISCPSWKAKV